MEAPVAIIGRTEWGAQVMGMCRTHTRNPATTALGSQMQMTMSASTSWKAQHISRTASQVVALPTTNRYLTYHRLAEVANMTSTGARQMSLGRARHISVPWHSRWGQSWHNRSSKVPQVILKVLTHCSSYQSHCTMPPVQAGTVSPEATGLEGQEGNGGPGSSILESLVITAGSRSCAKVGALGGSGILIIQVVAVGGGARQSKVAMSQEPVTVVGQQVTTVAMRI